VLAYYYAADNSAKLMHLQLLDVETSNPIVIFVYI